MTNSWPTGPVPPARPTLPNTRVFSVRHITASPAQSTAGHFSTTHAGRFTSEIVNLQKALKCEKCTTKQNAKKAYLKFESCKTKMEHHLV